MLPVIKDSDLYRIYNQNWRIPESKRAPGGIAKQEDFDVSTAAYRLDYHALREIVPDRAQDNYDNADLLADTTEELTEKIMRRKESDLMLLMTTTSWSQSQSLTSTAVWSLDTLLSNPIPVVDSGSSTITLNSGKKPNYMILPYDSFHDVKNHQSVLDRVKYTQRDVDMGTLQALFNMEEILIPSSVSDSAAEGATSSLAYQLVDKCFIGWKPARAGIKQPSAMYMFQKNVPMVRRYRDEHRQGQWIEVEAAYQFKVVASLSGYLINNIK
jgi:hypothetical protein